MENLCARNTWNVGNMVVHTYPFNSISFSNKTSVLIDACFLLALLSENDSRYVECDDVLKKLVEAKCQLYVTNIVSSEILNHIIYRLFENDIRYKIDKVQSLNTTTNIGLLLSNFKPEDKIAIKKLHIRKVCRINFKRYFNEIYKNARFRKFLKIYFEKSVHLFETLEQKAGVKYVSVNKDMLTLAKQFMINDMLGVNDANHLAAASQKNFNYLLTLDGDFCYVTSPVNVEILKI